VTGARVGIGGVHSEASGTILAGIAHVATYLDAHVEHCALPVRLNTRVCHS